MEHQNTTPIEKQFDAQFEKLSKDLSLAVQNPLLNEAEFDMFYDKWLKEHQQLIHLKEKK